MPIVKIIPSKGSVKAIRDYIMQENKTTAEYTMSFGCNIENPEEDFSALKEAYANKRHLKERNYYHFIVSYNTKTEKISPKEIKEMTEELCENSRIGNYQWFGAVHYKDTPEHLHCHIIVGNTAIVEDKEKGIEVGKSFRSTRHFRKEIMRDANELCKVYGYEHSLVSENSKNGRETMAEMALKAKHQKTWKDDLRKQIDNARDRADDLKDFKKIMKDSYNIEVMQNKKGELRYVPSYFEKNKSDCMKPCHERRLGGNYGRQYIETSFLHKQEQSGYERERTTELER